MTNTLTKLAEADKEAYTPFRPYEEETIISLALDHPEFFTGIGRFMQPSMFARAECQWVMAEILNNYEKFGVIPTRPMLKDRLMNSFTEDDPYELVLSVIQRLSDQREVPIIKDTLLRWAKDRAYGLLYSEEAQEAYARGEYEQLEQIVKQANRIADIGQEGFWFFEQYEALFDPEIIEHRTTGFPHLDQMLNNGGPSPKEVICWLAGTNVGKSILLCNNAISSFTGIGPDGTPGQNVLLITFELDSLKTAMRCLGTATKIPLASLIDHQEMARRKINKMKQTYNKRFAIYEWAPDECSVAHIYALLDNLRRTESFRPDAIIIDYMDLMVSRNPGYNKDDYTRQKHVANELRGLAKNENVVLFTATQTNRSGASGGEEMADMNKVAESYGKQFSLDYIISLNQTRGQRRMNPPRITMYIAKNRNGPRAEQIECEINYDNMYVKELL